MTKVFCGHAKGSSARTISVQHGTCSLWRTVSATPKPQDGRITSVGLMRPSCGHKAEGMHHWQPEEETDVIELENYLRLLSSSCTSSCQVSLLPDQTPAERASSRPARGSPPNVEASIRAGAVGALRGLFLGLPQSKYHALW
eukprot:g1419.t1